MKKLFFFLFWACSLFPCLHINAQSSVAPGGVVTNVHSLLDALGESATASHIQSINDTLVTIHDTVRLQNPIVINSGVYYLFADNGAAVIMPNDSIPFLFSIAQNASLNISSPSSQNLNSLEFNGMSNDSAACLNSALLNNGFLLIDQNVSFHNFNLNDGTVNSQGILIISGAQFNNCHSNTVGGALNILSGTLSVLNGSFIGNSSHIGGAISIDNHANVSISKIMLKDNFADSLGSAIYLSPLADCFSLTDSITLINNDLFISTDMTISAKSNFTPIGNFVITPESPAPCTPIIHFSNMPTDRIKEAFIHFSLPQNDTLITLLSADYKCLQMYSLPTDLFESACDSFYWEPADSIFTESTSYTLYIQRDSSRSCDSLVTLHLSINHFSETQSYSLCSYEYPFYIQNDTIESPGTYYYHYTTQNGCDSLITISVETVPTIMDTIPTITLCSNELPLVFNDTLITESGNYLFETPCGGTSLLQVNVLSSYVDTMDVAICSSNAPFVFGDSVMSESGDYHVFMNTVDGCDSVFYIHLTIYPEGVLQIEGDSAICIGDTALFMASPNFSNYVWNTNDSTSAIRLSETGIYTVTAIDSNGCSVSATKNLIVSEYPVPQILGDTVFCEGSGATLIAQGGDSYLWNTGDASDTVFIINDYHLILHAFNQYGCSATDTVNIIKNPLPVFELDSAFAICMNDSVIIAPSNLSYQYNWSTGDTLSSIEVSPITTTDYSLTVTNEFGCSLSKSTTVIVHELPGLILSGDTSFCEQSQSVLSATGGFSYFWSTGEISDTIVVTIPNQYFVIATNEYGCTSSDTISVKRLLAPIPLITGESTICSGDTAILSVEGAYAYQWNTGAQTADLHVADENRYSVTVTYPNACTATASKYVEVNPNPTIVIHGNHELCVGKSIVLTAEGGDAYLWSNGQNTAAVTLTPDQNTLYTVTVTSALGCTSTSSENVILKTLPIVSIDGDVSICDQKTTTLTATGGINYLWNDGTITPELLINNGGTYTVTVTADNGCTQTTSHTVTQLSVPTPIITGNNIICQNQQTIFSTSGGTAYQWNDNSQMSDIQVNVQGNYTVTVTYANGCTSSASRFLTVNPLPHITISGDTTICIGQTSIITAGGGVLYNWGGSDTDPMLITNPTQTQYKTIHVTTAAGCSSSRLVRIVVNPLPTPGILGESSFCYGDSLGLFASGGVSYQWANGNTQSSIYVKTTGNYIVTVTNSFGCTATASHPVTANPRPLISIIGNTSFCQGESSTLTAIGANSYLWSNGSTQQNTTVNTPNTYTVTASNTYGCASTASVVITPYTRPTASITGSTQFCTGQNTVLFAQGGQSYLWNDGTTDPSIIVTQAGIYTVTVSNAFGCSSSISKSIVVHPLPTANITGNNAFCEGNSTTLIASGGISYRWNDNSTNAFLNVSETGTYSVTVTDVNGCSAVQNSTVIVNQIPQISIIGDTNICVGNSTILIANVSGGAQYNWSSGETTSFINVHPSVSTNYTVVVTSPNGCTNTGRFMVNVRQYPTPSIIGNTSFCVGDSSTLTAVGGTTYYWNTYQETPSIVVRENGNYIVTVTNQYGCSSTATALVTVNTLPIPQLTGDASICQGMVGTLNANGGISYFWSTQDATPTIHPSEAGIYSVTITNENGCSASAQTSIAVKPLPEVSITGDNAICVGAHAILSASSPQSSNFVWSTQSVGSSTSVSTAGVYTVTATHTNGCSATASHTIIVNTIEVPTISGDLTPCLGTSTTLTASNAFTYRWSNGMTGNTITVTPTAPVTYSVTATNQNGCTATNSVALTIDPVPATIIQGNSSLCTGQSTTLTAVGGSNFVWSTQETGNVITVSESGIYYVTATNTYGCSASPSITVSVHPFPEVLFDGPTQICSGDNISLTTSGGSSYIWSNGSTTSTINVAPLTSTVYSCSVSNDFGCETVVTHNVTVNQLPSPQIYGNNYFCTGNTVQLVAAGGDEYVWSNGTENAEITVENQGLYSVTVSSNNCSASTYTFVSERANPIPGITGITQFCIGSNTTLTAFGGENYYWNNGENSSSIIVDDADTYSVTVSNASGCTATASVTTSLFATPSLTINGDDYVCSGSSLNLIASGGDTYLWSTGDNTPMVVVSPTSNTLYSVTATNENGCTAIHSVTVTVNPLYSNTFTDVICQGDSYSGYGFNLPPQQEAGDFTFQRVLSSTSGCDSIINLILTVNPLPILPDTISGTSSVALSGVYTYMVLGAQYADSYEWSISNPQWVLSSSTTHTVTLNINSNLTSILSVIGVNQCGISQPATLTIVSNVVSIEEFDLMDGIEIYPNPFAEVVNIRNNSSSNINKIQIFDLNGKLLEQISVIDQTLSLNLSSYPAGFFIVKLWNDNQLIGTVKLVKQ